MIALQSADKKNPSAQKKALLRSGAGGNLTDSSSASLQKIAKAMGNEELSKELQQQAKSRDAILSFICDRLKSIHNIQMTELKEINLSQDWFRDVAKGVSGFKLLDPTRWHDCAHLYQRAAFAICEGNLNRGCQLLEQ